MKLPFIKWYYRDAQSDNKLRMCSLEARGCWYEMLWVMASADRYGYLEHKGKPYTDAMLQRLIGTDKDTLYRCKQELIDAEVPSLDGETWFNRRMVQDYKRREDGRKFGKKGGGNPSLQKESENPESITQIPESQNPISICPPYKGQHGRFTESIKLLKEGHRDFLPVHVDAIINALKNQPDESKWVPAISDLLLHYSGAYMKKPVGHLVNYLAGKLSDQHKPTRAQRLLGEV